MKTTPNRNEVIVIYSEVSGTWGIVHAKSYQKAFRQSFKTELDALDFCELNKTVKVIRIIF